MPANYNKRRHNALKKKRDKIRRDKRQHGVAKPAKVISKKKMKRIAKRAAKEYREYVGDVAEGKIPLEEADEDVVLKLAERGTITFEVEMDDAENAEQGEQQEGEGEGEKEGETEEKSTEKSE